MSTVVHRRTFLALSGATLVTSNALAWNAVDAGWARDFGKFIVDGLATAKTPGMSVAIVRGGRTLFAQGYGYADVETARRVTADTVFQIASVSKTVTGTAMMMLWQDGAFKLDDPIARYLDFAVVYPKFPDVPITFRHLFTHTSGISDALYDDLEFKGEPQSLRDFLVSYLSPGGHLYDPAKSYSYAKPGEQWSYSNVAVALLGYLAGRVSRDPLDVVTKTRLFRPLGMRNTAWRYAGIPDERLAFPYSFVDARYSRLPKPAYPDWPSGLFCTSANDFAKFLQVYTQDGSAAGHPLLKPETIAAMLTPDAALPNKDSPHLHQGLIWLLSERKGDRIAFHTGGDPGAETLASFDYGRKTAALAFANSTPDRDLSVFQKEVIQRLLDKAVLF